MYGVVYVITNTVSGKRYVGQTTLEPEKRWLAHVATAAKNPNKMPIASAIRTYGPGAFRFEVVEQCDGRAALDAAEDRWIAELGTLVPAGYNLKTGGGGRKHHADTRRKMSASRLGRRPSAETIQKARQRMLGVSPSAETRAKISASLAGRKADPEAIAKTAAALRGRRRPAEHVAPMHDAIRGKPKSDEHRAKLAAANRGKKASDETRRKMAETQRARWAARKAGGA